MHTAQGQIWYSPRGWLPTLRNPGIELTVCVLLSCLDASQKDSRSDKALDLLLPCPDAT